MLSGPAVARPLAGKVSILHHPYFPPLLCYDPLCRRHQSFMMMLLSRNRFSALVSVLLFLSRQLRRHLSVCMISKLLDGSCTYKPSVKEFQVSSRSVLLVIYSFCACSSFTFCVYRKCSNTGLYSISGRSLTLAGSLSAGRCRRSQIKAGIIRTNVLKCLIAPVNFRSSGQASTLCL